MAIYMKVNGVDGHVTAKGHEKCIELDSVDWSVERSIRTKIGDTDNRESTTPEITEVSISKLVDKTSPLLFKLVCATGKSEGESDVVISFLKTDTNATAYLEFTLANVIFSSYSFSGGSDRPSESLSLNFTSLTMNMVPLDVNDKAATAIRATYNLTTGEAS